MPEENINEEFGLKKINETRNYLIEEINRNEFNRICFYFCFYLFY